MTEKDAEGTVQREGAIAKAISVLTSLRTQPDGSTARELASQTSIPRSTAQRILTTLTDTGMVVQDVESQRYYIGPHALWLGLGYQRSMRLINIARPVMVKLRDLTDETVGLNIAVGDARVFVEEVQSRSELRFASELGRYFPLWSGASGRVLMSGMSDEEIDAIHQDRTLAQQVDNPLSIEESKAAIARIRHDGYDTAFSESIAYTSSIAVPVREADGTIIAALSLSGPEGRLTRERMMEVLPHMLEFASEIGRLRAVSQGMLEPLDD